MDLGRRLAELKKERHMTTAALSERSGVPRGTINKLLTGETANPTVTTLRALAEALGIPVSRLCGTETDGERLGQRRVPLLGEIAAGIPIMAEEECEYVTCQSDLQFDFALRVRGDSMIGARIMNGDLVFIRSQPDVEDGEIAAVVLDDHVTLKHLYHIKNGVHLVSDNPKYPPMEFTTEEYNGIRVLGKAVAFQSRL